MPVKGDFGALQRVARTMRGLTTPGTPQRKGIGIAVVKATKALTREQFRQGIGPDGNPNRPRKDGKPALKSAKLARGAVAIELAGDVVRGRSKNPKWAMKLEAHQEGHAFPPGKSRQFRNAKGRLVSLRRYVAIANNARHQRTGGEGYTNIIRRTASGKTSTRATKTTIHTGVRILPPTPIYPAGGVTLTARWEQGIGTEVAKSIGRSLGAVKK